jgi:intraflagellar transport protein 88
MSNAAGVAMQRAAAHRRWPLARYVVTAAKLVAPRICPGDAAAASGFQWCMDELSRAQLHHLVDDVLMAKAAHSLPGDVDAAVDVFKQFERHSGATRAKAASNLSFLYLLEGNVAEAERYATMAKDRDEYHVQARTRSARHCSITSGRRMRLASHLHSGTCRNHREHCKERKAQS